jgi:hypothetical protein
MTRILNWFTWCSQGWPGLASSVQFGLDRGRFASFLFYLFRYAGHNMILPPFFGPASGPESPQGSFSITVTPLRVFLPEASEVGEKWTVIQNWGFAGYRRSVYILIPLLRSHSSSAHTTCSVTAVSVPTFHWISAIRRRHSFPINSALPV